VSITSTFVCYDNLFHVLVVIKYYSLTPTLYSTVSQRYTEGAKTDVHEALMAENSPTVWNVGVQNVWRDQFAIKRAWRDSK